MDRAARSPEDLETLFEDAYLMRHRDDLLALLEEEAVMVAGGCPEARDAHQIARLAADLWRAGHTYGGGGRRAVRWRDLALVVTGPAVHVMRRRGDGTWRLAICLLDGPAPQPSAAFAGPNRDCADGTGRTR